MSDPLFRKLRQITKDDIRSSRVVTPAVITGRSTDGRVRVRLSEGQCSVSAGRLRQAPGDVALVTPTSGVLRREQGTAGAGLAESTSTAPPLLWVESVEPNAFERGFEGTVVITGRGFSGSTSFQFLVDQAGELAPHPGITITSTEIVDDTTAELEVLVDVDADPVDEAPLGYSDTGGFP